MGKRIRTAWWITTIVSVLVAAHAPGAMADDGGRRHDHNEPPVPGGTPGGGTPGGGTTGGGSTAQLFAWNDLGMHCADSDFSVFTLLPPFNNLNAQLVVGGVLVNSGVTLTYEATADPMASVNSFSIGKTNFWTYDLPLFGVSLAPDTGLTGNKTASYTPAQMSWNGTYSWFEATGIPITPLDDSYRVNSYPLVKVRAFDSTGRELANASTVLPISSEIQCDGCHGANGNPLAMPSTGWRNTGNAQTDWRFNVLQLHDDRNLANATYTALLASKGYNTNGLAAAALGGRPVLCDTCHNSNALATWGIGGVAGVSSMTSAMHNRHANVTLPGSTQTLASMTTRDSCYNCHPGRTTQCLRGAMGNAVNALGQHTMECQSCHGNLSQVANASRNAWFQEPNCQGCHHDGIRETNFLTATASSDTRFATNANVPATGLSLYRFSKGHGNIQCEACHNSTHAEFPSSGNDNLRAIAAQGYAAAIRECSVCHAAVPNTTNGGPHGIHPVGQSWIGSHQGAPKTDCQYCHGTTSAGSPLAVVKTARSFTVEGGTKNFAAGDRVTCWSCHNGPTPG